MVVPFRCSVTKTIVNVGIKVRRGHLLSLFGQSNDMMVFFGRDRVSTHWLLMYMALNAS